MSGASENACRICGSAEIVARIVRTAGGVAGEWAKCGRRGVMRLHPYPAPDELRAYYENGYFRHECAGSVSHALRFGDENRPRARAPWRS